MKKKDSQPGVEPPFDKKKLEKRQTSNKKNENNWTIIHKNTGNKKQKQRKKLKSQTNE